MLTSSTASPCAATMSSVNEEGCGLRGERWYGEGLGQQERNTSASLDLTSMLGSPVWCTADDGLLVVKRLPRTVQTRSQTPKMCNPLPYSLKRSLAVIFLEVSRHMPGADGLPKLEEALACLRCIPRLGTAALAAGIPVPPPYTSPMMADICNRILSQFTQRRGCVGHRPWPKT